MDTPEKKTQPSPSLLSKFQDSPVFNYISSLSPIKPFNLGHSGRSFPLFTFASPQCLQTSPPISCPKESNITSAICVSDAPKNNCSQSGNEDEIATVSATEEALKMFIELPRSLKYECGSPQKSAVHCNVTKITPLKVIQDICKEVDHSSETDMDLQGIHLEKKKDVCDLEKFVYEASDILNYCSPTKEKHQEELDDTSVDSGTLSFVATVLQVPNEIVDGTWKMGSTPNYETSLLPAIKARAILAEEVAQFSSTEVDDKTFSEQQQTKKHMIARRPGSNKFSSLLPGIGLHLNALAATSRDKIIVKRQTLTCRRQLISSPCTVSSFDSLTSDTKPLNIQIAPGLAGNDGYEQKDGVQVTANACQSSTSGVDIQFHQSSPKKKRQKSEIAGETDSCKCCNCKRSKCLKLYCECFAAGLYCIGSCSCQDCFNKPIHEETVLETRRQIEARNPLAFAPKVIRGLSLRNGEELNKTPASARHKRGCNCKKSGCLKKYCECFQGGVGCSLSCRCEGCKNTFGHKEGTEVIAIFEETQMVEKNATNLTSSTQISITDEENQEQATPEPSKNARFDSSLLRACLV